MKKSNNINYYIKASIFFLIGIPILGSLGVALCFFLFSVGESFIEISSDVVLPIAFIAAAIWMPLLGLFLCLRFMKIPNNIFKALLPLFITFFYYILAWLVVFGLSRYTYSADIWEFAYLILTAPYIIANISFMLIGDHVFILILQTTALLILVASFLIFCKILKKKLNWDKRAIAYPLIFLVLLAVFGFQYSERNKRIVVYDFSVERIQDEVELWRYHPFTKDNNLTILENPSITITGAYPRLDGATAAYPVYAAMAQAIYEGLDSNTASNYIKSTNTRNAYERLINGEIDIFFGAQPSKQQLELAKSNGVALNLTPIAKEAFVFFVNSDNPIDSLTLEQIQDIYQKNISNWKELGGNNESIMAFQRPEGSGSQTIMLAMVLNGKELPKPLLEESAAGMGGIISGVAAYRNYTSAIGYSFRYFATGMNANENVKLLKINGIEPTIENIRNGTYPLTVDTYTVTLDNKPENKNTQILIDWILSEQGQDFIEECGYVRVK